MTVTLKLWGGSVTQSVHGSAGFWFESQLWTKIVPPGLPPGGAGRTFP